MVRLLSLQVWKYFAPEFKAAPVSLAVVSDLTEFNVFKRGTILKNIKFLTRTAIARMESGKRASVELGAEMPYVAHIYIRDDTFAAVAVTDKEYPPRIVWALLNKTLDEQTAANTEKWKAIPYDGKAKDTDVEPAQMTADLAKYQNAKEADKIVKVQKALDEVRDAMALNIEQLLRRGERLEDLARDSEDLDKVSKEFYKGAKKLNGCCVAF